MFTRNIREACRILEAGFIARIADVGPLACTSAVVAEVLFVVIIVATHFVAGVLEIYVRTLDTFHLLKIAVCSVGHIEMRHRPVYELPPDGFSMLGHPRKAPILIGEGVVGDDSLVFLTIVLSRHHTVSLYSDNATVGVVMVDEFVVPSGIAEVGVIIDNETPLTVERKGQRGTLLILILTVIDGEDTCDALHRALKTEVGGSDGIDCEPGIEMEVDIPFGS